MRKYIRNIVVILSMVMSGLLLGGCNHESVSSDVQGNDMQVYRKPIVALLDTSCEANFENVFWNNDDEIPNNHIDDDNNGYVDDLNGWDFVDDSSEVISDEFDNYGDEYVDVAAVSDNVSVELSNGEIIILSGTSVAAANVTKVAYYIFACSSVDMDSKSLKNRMCATLILDEDCKNMVRYGGIISLEDVLKYIK